MPAPITSGDAEQEAATVPLGTAVGTGTAPMVVAPVTPPIAPAAVTLPPASPPEVRSNVLVIAATIVVVGSLLGLLAAALLH